MYCNVESTGLPLGLFSTDVFWNRNCFVVIYSRLLDVMQYCCTLYLTARLLTNVRVDYLGPI